METYPKIFLQQIANSSPEVLLSREKIITEDSSNENSFTPIEVHTLKNNTIVLFYEAGFGTAQPVVGDIYPTENGQFISSVSSQVGCIIGCEFCDVQKFRKNLSTEAILTQLRVTDEIAEQKGINSEKIFKISFVDGGELILNKNFPEVLTRISELYPNREIKISTTLPNTKRTKENIRFLLEFIKIRPQVFLQISLASTDEDFLKSFYKIPTFTFTEIHNLGENFRLNHPEGRVPTISFTLTNKSKIYPDKILKTLPPDNFKIALCRFQNNHTDCETISDKDFENLSKEFSYYGYDVIGSSSEDALFLNNQFVHESSHALKTQ
jgi:adenine C2-methylase RlmN of 23S rRNA A2503 and tRNA A37